MAKQQEYEKQYSFQDSVTNNEPSRHPVNARKIDQEFNAIGAVVNGVNDNLSLIQRDDGKLKDATVEVHALSREVITLLGGYNLRGAFVGNAYYSVKDVVDYDGSLWACKVAHNANEFFIEPNFTRFGFSGNEDAAISALKAQQAAKASEQNKEKSELLLSETKTNAASASAAKDSSEEALEGSKKSEASATEAKNTAVDAKNRAEKAVMETEDSVLEARGFSIDSKKSSEDSEKSARKAEAAAASAHVSSGVYDSIASGLAETQSGQFFSVPSPNVNGYIVLYENKNGIGNKIKEYPSSKSIDDLRDHVDEFSALTKNSTVPFPLTTRRRNGVENSSILGIYMLPYILDIRVENTSPDLLYRVRSISSYNHPDTPNRWVFESCYMNEFDKKETRHLLYPATLSIIPNSGIQTYQHIGPEDLTFYVTVNTNVAPDARHFLSDKPGDYGYTYIIDPSRYTSKSTLDAAKNYALSLVEKPSAMSKLQSDLYNPMVDVNIRLVGDSITWGMGASNGESTSGNTGDINAPRNNLSAPCWANLLRNWIGMSFADGGLVDQGNGLGYFSKPSVVIPFSNDIEHFSFINTNSGKVISHDVISSRVFQNSLSPSGVYFNFDPPGKNINLPNKMEFEASCGMIGIHFARLALSTISDSFIDVYVDGKHHSKFNVYSDVAKFDGFHEVQLDSGRHIVSIVNNTKSASFRITHLSSKKTIRLANDGISASSTTSWINKVRIEDSVKPDDTYVFIQLGTNDRHQTAKLGTFHKNLIEIINKTNNIATESNIFLMSANAVTQNENPESTAYRFKMSDVDLTIRNLAKSLSLYFISNYAATIDAKMSDVVFLSDGLHPNDHGHRLIFENIKSHILKESK